MKKSLRKVLSVIMAVVLLIGGTSVVSFAEDGAAPAEGVTDGIAGISSFLSQMGLLDAILDIWSHINSLFGLPAIENSEGMAGFADAIVSILEPTGLVAIYDAIINNVTATQFIQKAIEYLTPIVRYFMSK